MKMTIWLATLLLVNTAVAAPVTYQIDGAHSFANWSIRHVVSKTTGTFNDISGEVIVDAENLANSSVSAKINMLSVNSGHAKRDAHIKEKDYLDTAQFAEMVFKSSKIVAKNQQEGEMTGKLTLHGITKEITLPFKVLGFGKDPWGGERSGFEAKTVIKASDYGFTWMNKPNAPLGDEIEVHLLIESVKAK